MTNDAHSIVWSAQSRDEWTIPRHRLSARKAPCEVDDIGSIMVAWDNGCGLSVAYGEDICRRCDNE